MNASQVTPPLARLQINRWALLNAFEREALLARPPRHLQQVDVVTQIIQQVRADGDSALKTLTQRFDAVVAPQLEVEASQLDSALQRVDPALRVAMENAVARIRAFHIAGSPSGYAIETAPGVHCERIMRPLDRVGLYVPGGSAPLFSTVLMLGVPAQLAGCPEIVLCTPPQPDGSVHAAVLAAAMLCGISRVFAVGGAQAIAAMALGTRSIPRCDKLFGPGNAWVTEAKRQVSAMPDGVAIDMPAGPSEVLVIADANANPEYVAADLLAQAEHGADSQVLLVTDSVSLAERVALAIEQQLHRLPRRDVAAQALQYSRIVVVDEIDTAIELSNRYAPEHLILQIDNPRSALATVRAAGSVFLGSYSPESVGDYCSGTNHVLPTDGWARSCSGVSVTSFQRAITVQQLSQAGLAAIGPEAIRMAEAEGLYAHAQSVRIRLDTAMVST